MKQGNNRNDEAYLQVAVTNTPELLTYAVPQRLAAIIALAAEAGVQAAVS